MTKKPTSTQFAYNRQAKHNYQILDSFEVGCVLLGSEVKSIRQGNVQLKEGYATIVKDELFLEGVYIKPYEHTGGHVVPKSVRTRKLLMHKKQIQNLAMQMAQQRLSLIPMKLYLKHGKIKLELALGKGKKAHDKRESIKQRDVERDLLRYNR
ncbi:SsrA-binding protein SmpB [bacterium]|nr:SsrA-binding protein SmpB [bacterium]